MKKIIPPFFHHSPTIIFNKVYWDTLPKKGKRRNTNDEIDRNLLSDSRKMDESSKF